MHGWIALPTVWYWVFLFAAPALGLAVGAFNRAESQVLLWLFVSCDYTVVVVVIAFAYQYIHEYSHFLGGFPIVPWLILAIPVFVFSLSAIGLPWAISRALCRLRNGAGNRA